MSVATRPVSVAEGCPGCGADAVSGAALLSGTDRQTASGVRFSVLRCEDCGLAFTVPRLRAEDFATYYPDAYRAYAPHGRKTGLAAIGAPLERLRIETVVRYGPYRQIWRAGPCRLLDVGCGIGDLAAVFARHGYDVAGVEPSAAAADQARERGIATHTGTLADAPWGPESFDAVVFNHSLEHVEDPSAALRAARRLLRPGGLVAVAVPNFGSWHRRIFGAAWLQLDLPRHQQHFDRRSLLTLLRGAGLDPIDVAAASMRPSLPGSVQQALLGRLRYEGRGFRIVAWAMTPFVALADVVAEGDCLHVTARR